MLFKRTFIQKGRQVATNMMHLGMIQASNVLVQLLLFPFIIRITGMEAFGPVVVANAFAALMGLVVNYGTSISGVQAVASMVNDKGRLSQLFTDTLCLRLMMLAVPLLALPVIYIWWQPYFFYVLLATPLVLAELVNPLYFFNGAEQLQPYNIGNLLSRMVSALLIYGFVDGATDAPWVNFFLGMPVLLVYLLLNSYLLRSFKLQWTGWELQRVLLQLKQNLPLAGNNMAVQLQQSFFLFVLSGTGNALLLGAYAIADKIVWGFRMLLTALFNALFPRAVILAQKNPALARERKVQINKVLSLIFLLTALFIWLASDKIVWLFAGDDSPLATQLLTCIALVPLLAALNLLNVMELVLQQRYTMIFRIAILLTLVTVIASLLVINKADVTYIAWYPLIMETSALLLYLAFLNCRSKQEVTIAL